MAELNFNLTPVKSENHLYNRSLKPVPSGGEGEMEADSLQLFNSLDIHLLFEKNQSNTLFMIVMSHRRRQLQRQRESESGTPLSVLENRKEKKDPLPGRRGQGGGGRGMKTIKPMKFTYLRLAMSR